MVITELHNSLGGRCSYLGRLRDSKVTLAELLSAGKDHASMEQGKGIEKKYKTRSKGFDIVIEELKKDIKAAAQKIKRFTERTKRYRENRMFVNNQMWVWQPDKEQIKQPLEGIKSVEAKQDPGAK